MSLVMSGIGNSPRWMGKEAAKFAAKVAHIVGRNWAIAVVRRADAYSHQYHVGCGNRPSAALNNLARDLVWWIADDARRAGLDDARWTKLEGGDDDF